MNDSFIAQKLNAEQSALHVTPQMRTRLASRMNTTKRYAAPRRVVLIALALLLITACAYAAGVRLGILDFIGQSSGKNVPSDAQQYITESSAVFCDKQGMFSVQLRQMAFDGSTVFAVIDITPESKSMFVMPSDSLPDAPASDFTAETKGTIREYCESKGYTDAWRVSVMLPSDVKYLSSSEEGAWCEDGYYTLYTTAQLEAPLDAVEGALEVILTRASNGDIIRIPCELSLSKATTEALISKNVSISVDRAGINIDRVELEKRAFDTWFTVYYTIANEKVYKEYVMGVDFRVFDENGKALPAGASGMGITELLPSVEGSNRAVYKSRQSVYMPTLLKRFTVEVFCPGETAVLDTFNIEFD